MERRGLFPRWETKDWILLVAWACSGRTVRSSDEGPGGLPWSRIRDSSLCLLEKGRVIIPYGIVRFVSEEMSATTPAAKALLENLLYLQEHVDNMVYDSEPWHLWEVFGAVFHAARINSLQIVDPETTKVRFSDICKGCLVNGCETEVLLRPVHVFKTSASFAADMSDIIPEFKNANRTVNWVTGDDGTGSVVINGAGGKGVDIFFCLPKASVPNEYVTLSDQRKFVAKSTVGNTTVKQLLSKARIKPSVAPGEVVVGLFYPLADFLGSNIDLPPNSFVLSNLESKMYHGSFAFHPACSPFVDVNHDPLSSLKLLFSNNAKKSAKKLIEGRPFSSLEGINSRVPGLDFKDESRISFD
eukprot:GHVR01044839.1.p1 GENE.GHVR01044839.1~~GHVR01044839.1.p1  ORF type:complete len:357 (+),score=11.53 GHVR01044839.1:503-1573(+)